MTFKQIKLEDAFLFIRNGKTVKQKPDAAGLPITRIETISSGEVNFAKMGYADLSIKDAGSYLLRKGDVLFSHINSVEHIGKTAIFRSDNVQVIHGMNLLAMRPDPEILLPEFSLWALRQPNFRHSLTKFINKAVNQASISTTNLKSLKIPLPTLKEQERIVKILNQAAELIRLRKEALAKLDVLSHAIFHDMFGDCFLNSRNWEVVEVGEVTSCIVPGRNKPKSFSGNIPWITTADLIDRGVTNFSTSGLGLSNDEINKVAAKVIPKGSVIMSCVGELGLTSIASKPMVINQQLHAFICGDKIIPEYLSHVLGYQKNWMFRRATQTTLPYMNKSSCNAIPIPLPPLQQQERYSEKIVALKKLYKTCQLSLKGSGNLLKSLENKILIDPTS